MIGTFHYSRNFSLPRMQFFLMCLETRRFWHKVFVAHCDFQLKNKKKRCVNGNGRFLTHQYIVACFCQNIISVCYFELHSGKNACCAFCATSKKCCSRKEMYIVKKNTRIVYAQIGQVFCINHIFVKCFCLNFSFITSVCIFWCKNIVKKNRRKQPTNVIKVLHIQDSFFLLEFDKFMPLVNFQWKMSKDALFLLVV